MFEMKKTLIVVYKDELLMNQLRKLVETKDDGDEVVGVKDDSVNIVAWTEKVWLDNKKAGNLKEKVLFLDDVKGTDQWIPLLDMAFDEFGVRFGWAGNQAVLYADPELLLSNKAEYVAFLEKLSALPVPAFLKAKSKNNSSVETSDDAGEAAGEASADAEEYEDFDALIHAAKEQISKGADMFGKFRKRITEMSEDEFRDKKLLKRQMLFYGVMNIYKDGLNRFLEL